MSFLCFGPSRSITKVLSKTFSRDSRHSRSRSAETNGLESSPSAAEDLDTFGEDEKSKRLHEEILSKLAPILSPTMPKFQEAFVNLGFLEKDGKQDVTRARGDLVRRVSSMNMRPSMASASFQVPSTQTATVTPPIGKASKADWSMSRKYLEDCIQHEASKDAQQIQPDFLSEESRLRERLKTLKLDMYVMQGDGNCQFRSVSFVLYGTQEHHQHVRQKAVAYMRSYPDDFEVFLGEDFDTYMSAMTKSGNWGDELTLRAICESYNMTINIITSTQQNWFLRYEPSTGNPPREIFLTYIAPIHYNAIRRRSALTPVRDSFRRNESQVEKAYRASQTVM